MYGKNQVSHQFPHADGSLLVNSFWYTLQGEGPDMGSPAVFLRLALCNLRCWFCDTEFDVGERMNVDALADNLLALLHQHDCHLVVITGGEPMLQNLIPLMHRLNAERVRVSIETAGTTMTGNFFLHFNLINNLIVCSPKTPKLCEELLPLIGAFKYIVNDGEIDPEDGLPIVSTQMPGEPSRLFRPIAGVPVFVQPMDVGDPTRNDVNRRLAAAVCMQHGYRLSLQMHKLVGVP